MKKWENTFRVIKAKKPGPIRPGVNYVLLDWIVVYKGTNDMATNRYYARRDCAEKAAAFIYHEIDKILLGGPDGI